MTDAQAESLVKKWQRWTSKPRPRQQWIPIQEVLTGKQTALFFQLDQRINLLLDAVCRHIPIVK
jgi:hypothetical protein